jgi:hypothetical protein
VSVRLLAHPVNHVPGHLDAVHVHAGSHERQRDTTGANGEVRALPVACEGGPPPAS